MPAAAPAPEREGAIVVTRRPCRAARRGDRSRPAAGTPRSSQRAPRCAARRGSAMPRRLRRAAAPRISHEAHGARGAAPVDARQVDAAAAPLRERDRAARCRAPSAGRRRVPMRRPARRCSARSAWRATCRAARARSRGGHGAAPRPEARPQGICGRRSRLESGSATRRCRCEPLLSNQSNKWDELRQVRLSAQGGPAQCCRKPRVPWVFQLGSEVTRPTCRTPQATPATLYTKHARRACRRARRSRRSHSSSCWPFSSALSTRSRSARTRLPAPLSTLALAVACP